MLRALLTAVALGIVIGQATLDYVFPEEVVTQGYDPETWKPCPGRKIEKVGKRRLYWYCGPDDAHATVERSPSLGASATSRSAAQRVDASGTLVARGHR